MISIEDEILLTNVYIILIIFVITPMQKKKEKKGINGGEMKGENIYIKT